jgi:hypothetical protein
MTELHWGVRVQEAFMAAVLIGPTTKTTTTALPIDGFGGLEVACWPLFVCLFVCLFWWGFSALQP